MIFSWADGNKLCRHELVLAINCDPTEGCTNKLLGGSETSELRSSRVRTRSFDLQNFALLLHPLLTEVATTLVYVFSVRYYCRSLAVVLLSLVVFASCHSLVFCYLSEPT